MASSFLKSVISLTVLWTLVSLVNFEDPRTDVLGKLCLNCNPLGYSSATPRLLHGYSIIHILQVIRLRHLILKTKLYYNKIMDGNHMRIVFNDLVCVHNYSTWRLSCFPNLLLLSDMHTHFQGLITTTSVDIWYFYTTSKPRVFEPINISGNSIICHRILVLRT